MRRAGQVHRFGEEVEGAALQGIDRGVQTAESGDHRHRHLRVTLLDVLHQLKAGAIGQAHVGQAQVEGFASQPLTRFFDIPGAAGVQLHAAEGDFQQFADVRLVVHDQNFLPSAHSHPCLRGWAKVIRIQLPPLSRGL
jgi:hypothetical protein